MPATLLAQAGKVLGKALEARFLQPKRNWIADGRLGVTRLAAFRARNLSAKWEGSKWEGSKQFPRQHLISLVQLQPGELSTERRRLV